MSDSRRRPIRRFNPGTLQSDAELIEQFVVREAELESVRGILRGNLHANFCQHVLIVGARGMGKTMLLARVAAELRTDRTLATHLLPVRFMEESHELFNMADFWLEVLFYLARAVDDPDVSRDLEEAHAGLLDAWQHDDLEQRARSTVLDVADQLGKRLVVMVENLQSLIERVDVEFCWALAAALESEPRIMLVATATSRFLELDNEAGPFVELFQELALEPLNDAQCLALWQEIRGAEEGERGEHVITPLRILTGGSPRLLVIVADFTRYRSVRQLMEELVQLVDENTEYLRRHLDAISARTERRVYVALIDLWRPSTSIEIATRARIGIRVASNALGRLVRRGMVLVDDSGMKLLYCAAERLHSIYYKLQRERGEAAVVRNLLRFMTVFYDATAFAEMAPRFEQEAAQSPQIREGIQRARAELPLVELCFSVGLSQHHVSVGQRLLSLMDAEQEAGELTAKLALCDAVIERYGVSNVPRAQEAVADALFNKGVAKQGEPEEAIVAYDELIERCATSDWRPLQVWVAKAMWNRALVQGELGRWDAELAGYGELVARYGASAVPELQQIVLRALSAMAQTQVELGDYVGARATYDTLIARYDESEETGLDRERAEALLNRGVAESHLGNHGAQIAACDEVIVRWEACHLPEAQKIVAQAMINKAAARASLEDSAAAIETWEQVVQRYASSNVAELSVAAARAWLNKAATQGQRGDHHAVITTCREVMERYAGNEAPELQAVVARAVGMCGVAYGELGDQQLERAAYGDLLERYATSEVLEHRIAVARALVSKGVAEEQRGIVAAAVASFEDVVQCFGASSEPELAVWVARALLNEASLLDDHGAAIACYNRVVEHHRSSHLPELQKLVSEALSNTGMRQGMLGRVDEEIATYDDVCSSYGSTNIPQVQETVARALFRKAAAENTRGNSLAAIEAYSVVVDRYAANRAPELQKMVAEALVIQGLEYVLLDDFEAASTKLDDVLARFGGSDFNAPEELQVIIAAALFHNGFTKGKLGRWDEGIAAYDELIERYGASDVAEVQWCVAFALYNRGGIHTDTGNADDALRICDQLERSFGAVTDDASVPLAWKAHWLRIAALLSQGKRLAAIDSFRSAYVGFDAGNESMLREMLDGVIDLVAHGAPTRELVMILTSDARRSDTVAPLVAALRLDTGEQVRAPGEVLEVAADIRERFTAAKRAAQHP